MMTPTMTSGGFLAMLLCGGASVLTTGAAEPAAAPKKDPMTKVLPIPGEVFEVRPGDNKALVRGVNLVKRHHKQTQAQEGGIISKESPIHLSKISHVDPKTGAPTRIGFKILGDGRRVRFAKKSGEVLDV